MPYGLTDIELQKLLDVFVKNERIDQVILYGSRAKGNFKPFSDVDITLVGSELSRDDLNKVIQEIDDLLLPYQFDVSLKHKLKNEVLIDHIERRGIEIYKKESMRECKLSDIAKYITSGGTPKSSEASYYDGDIPWLNTKEINFNRVYKTERFITEAGLQNSSAKWIPKNSVIVAMYGATAGRVAYSLIDLTTNQACCNIVVNDKHADSLYIFFYLQNSYTELVNLACGAAQQNLNINVISNFPILLPSLEKQKRISSILSSLDDKIDLLHRENKTLETMAETLFRKWFIENIKEDWKEGTLDDILSVKGGTTPSTKEPKYWDGNISWTSPKDITTLNGIYLFDTERKITREGLKQISSGLLPVGTLLMSSRAPVGVLAYAEIPLAINQGYIAVIDDKGYAKEFVYLWLKVNMDMVHSYANGSTFMEISKSAFKSLSLQIPPKHIVDEFCKDIKPIFEKIKINELQIRTINKTKDNLLPKLMSNE